MNNFKVKPFLPKTIIKQYQGSSEREMFGLKNTMLSNCTFAGPGESPVKDCVKVVIDHCNVKARYAFWEGRDLFIRHCQLRSTDRAPLWYTHRFVIEDSRMFCPKGFRECSKMIIKRSLLHGTESLWQITDFEIDDLDLESYYPFLECHHGKINNLRMKGKYSFQHCSDIEIDNSTLDTKDAFWHSHNIVVKNSFIKGEYVAWYSQDLTFINCTFSGTQPFVSSTNMKFVDCTFLGDTDRAFEKSAVSGSLKRLPLSVYNPKKVILDCLDEKTDVVIDNPKYSDYSFKTKK
ncbi:MAG: DUF3737 family protein [Bacilli bacterium]|jgi:hypothetical protein